MLDRKKTNWIGLWVVALSVVGFALFFLRDALLARYFGVGQDLDTFYFVMLIPNFLVAISVMPYGQAYIPYVQEDLKNKRPLDLGPLIPLSLFSLLTLLPLIFFSNQVVDLMGLSKSSLPRADILMLIIPSLSIFLFSLPTVIGNSLINAIGKSPLSALCQMALPLGTCLTLFVFKLQAVEFKAIHALYALAFGQVCNMALLLFALWYYKIFQHGLSFKKHFPRSLVQNYAHLIISAFMSALIVPMLVYFAGQVSSGAVSALTLGGKATALATGLISILINSVLLPHFSSQFLRNNDKEAMQDLSYYLALGNGPSLFFALILGLFSLPFVHLVFAGGKFSAQDTQLVAEIMKISVLQTPFIVTMGLIQRYYLAKDKSFIVVLSTFVGLVSTFILAYLFKDQRGVIGIMQAATLGSLAAAFICCAFLFLKQELKPSSFLFIIMAWSGLLAFNREIESSAIYALLGSSLLCLVCSYLVKDKNISATT